MGREKKTDGTKLIYTQMPTTENDFKKIGKERLRIIFKKAVEKELHNMEKGKVHNQVDLISAIEEVEKINQK